MALLSLTGPGTVPQPSKPASAAPPQAQATTATAPTSAKDLVWIRSRQDDNRVLRLQLAIREFVPKAGEGPTITLHGAVHIADRAFYKQLERTLEQDHDIILFEGVKPGGLSDDPLPDGEAGELARAERTRERLRLAWIAVERWRKAAPKSAESMPVDLASLRARMTQDGRNHEQMILSSVLEDGWRRPFVYSRATDGKAYSLGSLGKDNALGGDGPDKDLFTTDLRPLKRSELGDDPGLQKRLAETLGLTFQLDEMAHAGPKWKNADMSIDDVQEALGMGRPVEGDAEGEGSHDNLLFALLDGSSLPAKVASMALTLIESVPGMAPRMKVMMVELLANLDMDALEGAGGPAAKVPGMGDMKQMMDVIIDKRNQVVIDELKKLIKDRPELKRIAVVYGAGHLPDLAQRLEDQLGYRHKSGKWITAIRTDLNALGITEDEMRMTRTMMKTQMKMLSGRAAEDRGVEIKTP